MKIDLLYRCIHDTCEHSPLKFEKESVKCGGGHIFPFAPNSQTPIFHALPEGESEYTLIDAVAIHDNAFSWLYRTFNTNEQSLRGGLVSRLCLNPGMKVLVAGAGTCNDIPFIAAALQGSGHIHAQDVSAQMLLEGVRRYRDSDQGADINLSFSVGDVKSLPFQDGTFDAAFHFGGVNVFGDIKKGFAEINRVVKQGGRVVVSDEGVAPWLQSDDFGRMMICNNPLYASQIPLESLPATVTDAKVSWILSSCFYVIEFIASHKTIEVDIDVKHLGTRGGTIRTRYFGQLEGINPDLKAQIYQEAKKRHLSRVELIEHLLSDGFEKFLANGDVD